MKIIKAVALLLLTIITLLTKAQDMSEAISNALSQDDSLKLTTLITKENVNNCYGNYSLLSEAIRKHAKACFSLLIEKGADVNKSCNAYVPPLMHACKYGDLDMVKILIAKGAKKDYVYDGTLKLTNGPEKGDTPLSYAQKYQHDDIAEYLQSLK